MYSRTSENRLRPGPKKSVAFQRNRFWEVPEIDVSVSHADTRALWFLYSMKNILQKATYPIQGQWPENLVVDCTLNTFVKQVKIIFIIIRNDPQNHRCENTTKHQMTSYQKKKQ
jgi:hypothetical protein